MNITVEPQYNDHLGTEVFSILKLHFPTRKDYEICVLHDILRVHYTEMFVIVGPVIVSSCMDQRTHTAHS